MGDPPKELDAPKIIDSGYTVLYPYSKIKYFVSNSISIAYGSKKKIAADIGLKVVGAGLGYGLGWLVGQGLDHIPYVNDGVNQAVDFIGIGEGLGLEDLLARLGAIYGAFTSGIQFCALDAEPHRIEKIKIPLFSYSKGNNSKIPRIDFFI